MTTLGQPYQGTWPEHPINKPEIGQIVRYPEAGTAKIRRGKIGSVGSNAVFFVNGKWAYLSEISEDQD